MTTLCNRSVASAYIFLNPLKKLFFWTGVARSGVTRSGGVLVSFGGSSSSCSESLSVEKEVGDMLVEETVDAVGDEDTSLGAEFLFFALFRRN